jgi:hypothetical protein
MHECNGVAKFARIRRPRERFACLINLRRSLCDQPAASVGANEGQMRELNGYLVACRGAEAAAARMAVGIPRSFLCKQFLRKEERADYVLIDHALIDEESIGACIAIGKASSITHTLTNNNLIDRALTDSVRTSSPITIIYARENLTDDAVEEIARAIPAFGALD